MHPSSEIISVCDCFISSCSLLIQDLDKDFHGTNQNWSQSFDLFQVQSKTFPLVGIEKIKLSGLNILTNFGQTRTEVLDNLDKILHGLNELGDCEIIQNFLTILTDLPYL